MCGARYHVCPGLPAGTAGQETLEGTYLYEYRSCRAAVPTARRPPRRRRPRRMGERSMQAALRALAEKSTPGRCPAANTEREDYYHDIYLSSLAEQGQGMDERLLQPHPKKQPHKGRSPDPAAHRPCARRHGACQWRRCIGAGRWLIGGLVFGLVICGIYLAILMPSLSPARYTQKLGAERPGAFHGRNGAGTAGHGDAGGAGGQRGIMFP